MKYFSKLIACLLALLSTSVVMAQIPFVCDGTAYVLFEETDDFRSYTIDPTNNAILFSTIRPNIGNIDGIGFNPSDNLIYGVRKDDLAIVTIDALGDVRAIGMLPFISPQEILAGDMDPSGRYYHCILSSNGSDQKVLTIDLLSAGFPSTEIVITGNSNYIDVARDPTGKFLYAVNRNPNFIAHINLGNGQITNFQSPMPSDGFSGLYFNPFGDLIAFGSTAFGIASSLFKIDKNTGEAFRITTGPESNIYDMASCPYTVAANYSTEFNRILPCTEVNYILTIANASTQQISNIDVDVSLPIEFNFLGYDNNPFGGSISFNNATNNIEMRNIILPIGTNEIDFSIEVDDIPTAVYSSRATLLNLPANLGEEKLSDNPATIKNDATEIEVLRPNSDSSLHRFICLGQTLVLDASDFGNELVWQDGTTESIFEVTEGGVYSLTSSNDCIDINIEFEVTVASCPFTIGVDHIFRPDSTLSCSEIEMLFIMINDSGITHENILFRDSLPDNIEFLEVLKNPYGGTLNESTPPNIIEIEGLTFNSVIDTIIIKAYVGEIPPGTYFNACKIEGFPMDIGFFRESDDPSTPPIDSTSLQVLGVPQDSLQIPLYLCEGESLKLDGTPYGVDHSWSTGESTSIINIQETGTYQLTAFNGCDPAYIFFNVMPAKNIAIELFNEMEIRLGEQLVLSPTIENDGDSLFFHWVDDFQTQSLSCLNCLEPIAFPLTESNYRLFVSNEDCKDSIDIKINVDNTRRIYSPNIFSPNEDGVNDLFYLYSPDFGIIKDFKIYDRWGTIIYESKSLKLNNQLSGWDGKFATNQIDSGVYTWYAEMEFLDGLAEFFTGSITLIK